MTPDDLGGILMRAATTTPERLHRVAALAATADWYARSGLPIFPCTPHEKTPNTPHGLYDATTQPEQVRDWWRARPARNIGFPTGHLFDVIDIDGDKGGVETAQQRAHRLPEPVAVAATGSGWHLYVRPNDTLTNAARADGDWKGVDFRAEGGYVLLPPSRHPSGRLYQWLLPPNLCRSCRTLLVPEDILRGRTYHPSCLKGDTAA